MMTAHSILVTATALFITTMANQAAVIGSDLASDPAYDDGWQTGDDGGTAATFGPWNLTSQGAQSGGFIGDSTTLNPGNTGANINTSGESFGLFGHSGQTSEAFRDFGGLSLEVDQTFSVELALNFRNGNKGFDLRDASDNVIFNFNIGADDYTVNLAASGNGSIGSTYSADTEFALSFHQSSLTGGTWTITRSGGVADVDSGTYSGVAENIKLYVSQTTGVGAAEDNLYVNSLQIVPEPTTGALVLTAFAGLCLRRRRADTATSRPQDRSASIER
jgi:hypothetical protein